MERVRLPTPHGQREFCGLMKKLDETLPLAETFSLANADLADRFSLATRDALQGATSLPEFTYC